jgi:N-acetylmuramoyl-L-alanine amidase
VTRQTSHRTASTYQESASAVPVASRLVVVVSCVAATMALTYGMWWSESSVTVTPEVVSSPAPSPIPYTPLPLALDHPTVDLSSTLPPPTIPPDRASDTAMRIGIVAGHWGSNDTGAICPDGLAEVEINLEVAQRVVYILQALGYQADLLAEFDPRLDEYQAGALVSVHADSCEAFPNAIPPASGFKVASVEDSLVPEAEGRLVTCLAQCYAARTGMYFHENSITYDMTRYHTFYEIDDRTPAAIIETGFMHNDRALLTQRADLVAQGIVDGIVCFIESEGL